MAALVIANGGILTSPDRPGVNLDPEAMQPSLMYPDTADGKMRGEYRLHDRQLSIHCNRRRQWKQSAASHAGEDILQLFPETMHATGSP